MAIARLVPSTYYLSNTSYLKITNPENMYTNTDNNSTYSTTTNSRASTTSYYLYIRGFNFDSIPSSATINSFTVKLRAKMSGCNTSTSYRPQLCNGTTTITNTGSTIGTTATTISFSGLNVDFATLKSYGSNFGIRIDCRRASRNTTSYMYVYGAEIYVDYTEAVYYNITTSGTNCTLNPSGTTSVAGGTNFTLQITSTNANNPILIDNGIDKSSSVIEGSSTTTAESYPTSYSTQGSISGTYYQNAIGKGHTTANTTNNCYASSSGSTATIIYKFTLPSIPSNATIKSVVCQVKGHEESTTSSSEVAKCQLYKGSSTAVGSAKSFTSTTDQVLTLDDSTWTVSELNDLELHFTIGYYGGNVSGATLSVEYEVAGSGERVWTYTITNVQTAHTIVVSFADESHLGIFIKISSTEWIEGTAIYIKQSGGWVKQTADPSSIFDTGANYKTQSI